MEIVERSEFADMMNEEDAQLTMGCRYVEMYYDYDVRRYRPLDPDDLPIALKRAENEVAWIKHVQGDIEKNGLTEERVFADNI